MEKIIELCNRRMKDMGIDTDPYQKRLRKEFREIDAQNEWEYFSELFDKKARFATNQNNLLVPYLLGIVKDVDINKEPNWFYGEFPDIDVDYLPIVQPYLKNVWAPKEFGEEYVCNVGTYQTFAIKNTFKDLARIYDLSHSEVNEITKRLPSKDDEGHILTFDNALRLYPELQEYCKKSDIHEKIEKAVRKFLFRNHGTGKHAGGLVICSEPISDFVPLIKNIKDDTITTAWIEGLLRQDLGPMGLIKFDALVVSDLMRIAIGTKLVKERHNLESFCALPELWDWSDTAYKNDPKSLEMANAGDLKGIFQFDSEGIRALARKGGVDSFNDLAVYSAIYRPGPLGEKMHERYIERKHGREDFEIHPIMAPYLGVTYGVLVYQEQIMQILNVVADIPLKDCYIIIKAIAKKKVKFFAKYKNQFLTIGKQRLGWTDAEILSLWMQIESFAEYGFNKSHAVSYAYISARLLKIKSHYPLEFYAATLACEGKTEKIKEYKTEAENHGVEVNRVDLNKSSVDFKILDDKIYLGFSNIKKIGSAAARIVEGQPYKGIEDFLQRFGTDKKALLPLISLRVFKESDPITLWKFYEYYVKEMKKRNDRRNRFKLSQKKTLEKLKDLLPEEYQDKACFDIQYLSKWKELFDFDEEIEVEEKVYTPEQLELQKQMDEAAEAGIEFGIELDMEPKLVKRKKSWNRWKEVQKLWKSWEKSQVGNVKKTVYEDANPPKFEGFNPYEWPIEKEMVEELRDEKGCEMTHYGFEWRSDLEESPDFKGGHTFEAFKAEVEMGTSVFMIEAEIKKAEKKTAKNGNIYHTLELVDANGEKGFTTVWSDDWERWSGEMVKGNLVKIRLKPPSGGFKSYTFDSPPRHRREKEIPKDKRLDVRLCVMRPPVRKEIFTEEEIMKQMAEFKMEIE